MRSQLELIVSRVAPQNLPVEIQIMPHENVTQAILKASQSYELVVLRSLPRRVGVDGLAIGEVTTPLLQQLTCSVVILGEPQETPMRVVASR
jgi:nucleotide-binding universal stress UspA family protein